MEELVSQVKSIELKELERANAEYPPFSSPHEGYGVMLEEVDEADEDFLELLKSVDILWKHIKSDMKVSEYSDLIQHMERKAIFAACESIQVAAMCRKYIDSLSESEPHDDMLHDEILNMSKPKVKEG